MAQWFESIGLTPGYLLATLAGSAEFFGGLALVIGLLVRPASVVVGFTMIWRSSACTSAMASSSPTTAMNMP